MRFSIIACLIGLGLVFGCGQDKALETEGDISAMVSFHPDTDDLNDFFDCLDAENVTLISAHRGGSYPSYPENALETMRYVAARIPVIMEIDVATSKDGVLFLLHDDRLERTTNGYGIAAEKTWTQLSALNLKDDEGALTPYRLAKFAAVLSWAEGKSLLQVDFKKSTSYKAVIDVVRRQQAQSRVIYISYNVAQAQKIHRLDPEAMISITVDALSDLDGLDDINIPADRLIAWTGNEAPNPALWQALDDLGIEVIFGTLGGANSLDAQIATSGEAERYYQFARNGVDIIATDRPLEAAQALEAAGGRLVAPACGIEMANGVSATKHARSRVKFLLSRNL